MSNTHTDKNTAKKKKIAYYGTTGLFVLAITPGGVMNIVQPDILVDMAGTLGVPLHMMTLLGVWKLLGVVALLAPGFKRIKDAAYAGFFFDLTGAAYLHAAVGDNGGIAGPLVIATFLAASWFTRMRYEEASPASITASHSGPLQAAAA